MTQKLGYGYQNLLTYQRPYSAEEERALFDHFIKIHPGASLFLDNEPRAQRAKALVPECAVVVRSYLDGEGDLYRNENASPQTVFGWYKNTPKGLIRNILNEPNSYVSDDDLKRLAHWCAEIADLFGNAGIPVVLPNFGEGHPDEKRLHLLEELWKAFDKWHDLHFYGGHEYGSHLGMIWNGGDHKYDMYPWRVGRFEMLVKPYLESHGHKIPNVILTEFGCDSAHDNTTFRGWSTCWTEQQYFDELQSAITKVYDQPHYVGLCLFSYGNTGKPNTQEDWSTFDLSGAKAFQGLLEDKAKAVDVPKVVTSPLPDLKPDNLRFPVKRIIVATNGQGKRNLRNGRTTKHKVVGVIGGEDVLTIYDPIITQKDTDPAETVRRWQWVETTLDEKPVEGWLCIDGLAFAPPPAPVADTPAPVVPPSTNGAQQPLIQTFVIPMNITVRATSQEAAEAAATAAMSLARNGYNQFVEMDKLRIYLAANAIQDVQFVIQLAKLEGV